MQKLRNFTAELLSSRIDKAISKKTKSKAEIRRRAEIDRLEHWQSRIPPPLEECKIDPGRSISQQKKSKFLTLLPIELRQAIYKYALGGEELELQFVDDLKQPTFTVKGLYASLLSLPKTCRKVYAEAIEYVYSQNTFVARQIGSILFLHCFCAPRLYHNIRSLHFRLPVQFLYISYPPKTPPDDEATWEATWAIIADMRGLKNLQVHLLNFNVQHSDTEQAIFKPMIPCKDLESFDVTVHWVLKTKESELPFPVKQADEFQQS